MLLSVVVAVVRLFVRQCLTRWLQLFHSTTNRLSLDLMPRLLSEGRYTEEGTAGQLTWCNVNCASGFSLERLLQYVRVCAHTHIHRVQVKMIPCAREHALSLK